MKKPIFTLIAIVLLLPGAVFADAMETISQAEVEEAQADPKIKVTIKTKKSVSKSVVLGAGACNVSIDALMGDYVASYSLNQCQEVQSYKTAKLNPKGFFNRPTTYVIEGSQQVEGYDVQMESKIVSRAVVPLAGDGSIDSAGALLKQAQLINSCETTASQVSKVDYSESEKEAIANCFGL